MDGTSGLPAPAPGLWLGVQSLREPYGFCLLSRVPYTGRHKQRTLFKGVRCTHGIRRVLLGHLDLVCTDYLLPVASRPSNAHLDLLKERVPRISTVFNLGEGEVRIAQPLAHSVNLRGIHAFLQPPHDVFAGLLLSSGPGRRPEQRDDLLWAICRRNPPNVSPGVVPQFALSETEAQVDLAKESYPRLC